MAHIFDQMVSINGHLNILSKHYLENANLRTINTPYSVMVVIERMVNNVPSIVNNTEESVECDVVSLIDSNDKFNPIYVAVVTNINDVFVDKVPVIVNYKDQTGPGIGYVIIIPKNMFDNEASVSDVASKLKTLYFKLLELDPDFTYDPDSNIIKHSENKKMYIPTYDVMMAYAAVGFMVINMRSWYRINNKPISAQEALDELFDDEEVPANIKSNLADTLTKYSSRVGDLRDAVGSGVLIMETLFDVE